MFCVGLLLVFFDITSLYGFSLLVSTLVLTPFVVRLVLVVLSIFLVLMSEVISFALVVMFGFLVLMMVTRS